MVLSGNDQIWNATQTKELQLNCGGSGSDFKSGSRTDSTIVVTYFRPTAFCDGTLSNPDCILTIRGKLALRLVRG
jgi:hypothetical protein